MRNPEGSVEVGNEVTGSNFVSPGLGHGFEKRNHLLPLDRREPLEEIVNRISRLQVIERRLHWHPCPGETGRPTHDLGVRRDDLPLHEVNVE